MKKKWLGKSAFWGLIIILIAVYLILSNIGILHGSVLSVILTIIMLAITISGFAKLQFTGALLGLSHLVYMYRDPLHIPESLSGWIIILAGVLIGIGLDMILKNAKRNHNTPPYVEFVSDSRSDSNGQNVFDYEGRVSVSNSFGDHTKYVDSNNLSYATVENSFGNLTVYFDNAVLSNAAATIDVKNGFGNCNLYLPATWRLDLHEDSGFGKVLIHGAPSHDPQSPVVHLKVDNGFGSVQIYFS